MHLTTSEVVGISEEAPAKDASIREPGLSIIIPVYNERAAAENLGERLQTIAKSANGPIEFVLVDDGSTDGTRELLQELDDDSIRVLRHQVNRGYGASLKTGINAARYDWVATTDADETYPDERIPELLANATASGNHMVVGARTGDQVSVPLLRRPPKWFLRRLASWLSGHPIPDLNSGLRVMRKDVVKRFLHVLPNGFSFSTTITLSMLSSGYMVEYVPIDYSARTGTSKIRPIYDTLNFLQLVIRTVLWFNPLRVFIPLSAVLFVSSFVVLFGSRELYGRAMDTSFAVLIMTSVITMAIGMLADLIDKRL